jgi:predicted nuclease of predicted toxin-antitoxin system
MKIYADENIEQSVVEGLRRRGVDVVSAGELGYMGKSDDFHLKKAAEMKAVILTHDIDFIVLAEKAAHHGIIFSHSKNVSIGQCVRGIEVIVSILTDKDMKNHIEFL